MLLRILAVACFALSVAQAQDIQYVSAENGLVMREQPNQGAVKVGVLDYGTPVEIIEYTDLSLDVRDNKKKVTGKWVKIKGPAAGEYFEDAYVFNGYLTEEKIERPLKIPFDAFTVFIDKLNEDVASDNISINKNTSPTFKIEKDKSPENRYLKVKHHQDYRTIQVLQRYRNSMAITSVKGETKFSDFQHYTSSWKPLKMLYSDGNIFKTIALSEKDQKRFGTIDEVKLNAYLKNKNQVRSHIAPSQIEFKVIMTDIDGYRTEKNVIFELPLKS